MPALHDACVDVAGSARFRGSTMSSGSELSAADHAAVSLDACRHAVSLAGTRSHGNPQGMNFLSLGVEAL